jgi:hypothetical protein
VPAYLADIFGTQFVGAIHGRLLTAWSTAGVVGPLLVTQIREWEIAHGFSGIGLYGMTMYVLAGLLVLGFMCNLLVRPLSPRWFMTPEAVAALQVKDVAAMPGGYQRIGVDGVNATVVLAWLAVGIPLAWGVWITLNTAAKLFA